MVKFSKTALNLSISACVFASFTSGTAMAQDVTDEIIVTARKQAQSLQDVPLSITALSDVEIEAAGLENIIELAKVAPGLFIEPINGVNARVQTQPRFRGIVFDANSPLQRTATVFVDGVLTSGGLQSLGFNEVERVEIIKGPQSALFGRNTFSGAINYITRDPSEELSGEVSVLAATRDEYRVNGSLEGGLLGDTLTGRVSGGYNFNGGHFDNAAVAGQELGEETDFNINATLLYKPTDNFRAKIRGGYYGTDDGPAAVVRTAGLPDHNFGGFPDGMGGTTETAFLGTLLQPDAAGIALNTGPADFDRFLSTALADGRAGADGSGIQSIDITFEDLDGFGVRSRGFRTSFDATYDFSNGLSFDFLTGYNEDEFLLLQDFDASGDLSFTNSIGQEVQDFSIEGRLSGNFWDNRLKWSFGVNYLDVDVETVGGFRDEFGFFGFFFPGLFEDRFFTAAETFGVFGTVDYSLTDELTVIFEGRWQEDQISNASEDLVGISPGTFRNFLPRVLLQYQPSDDTTLYANFSQGNLPGGFNPEVGELDAAQLAQLQTLIPGIGTTFSEEGLTNYELGWKQTAFDGQFAFNAAAFYMRRTDQIFSGFELVMETPELAAANGNEFRTVAFTDNGATTDIFGLEFDATANVSEELTLQGSFAWIDASVASFPAGSNAGDFTAVFGTDADPAGQRAPRFPEFSGSFSGTYEKDLGGDFYGLGDAQWYTRGDLFYTGEFFDEVTNLASTPAAVDANLRTGLKFDNYSIELFVTNLFDEDAPIGANNTADTSFDVRGSNPFNAAALFNFSVERVSLALRPRRQFGARASLKF